MLTEDLKAKLTKLNALAERAGTPEEAAAARGQFAKLCLKHGIVADDISWEESDDGTPEPIVESPEALFAQGKIMMWKWRLASGIGAVNGVFMWRAQYRKVEPRSGKLRSQSHVMMAGPERGIQTTRYLFDMLVADTERLARKYCKGTTRTWGNNFRHGVVDTLLAKVKEAYGEAKQELAAEGNTKALVRLTDALARKEEARVLMHAKHNLRSGSAGGGTADPGARAQGRVAGQSVRVGRAAQGLAAGRAALGSGRGR